MELRLRRLDALLRHDRKGVSDMLLTLFHIACYGSFAYVCLKVGCWIDRLGGGITGLNRQ